MPLFYLKSTPSNDPRSGLSGSPELQEPAPPKTRRSVRETTAAVWRTVTGTVAGIPRIFRLVWRASRTLTVCLALATVVTGLVPAATAATAALLIDAVDNAIQAHAGTVPDEGLIGPFAGVEWHTSATGAVLAAVGIQFLIFMVNAVVGSARTVSTELLQERVAQDVQVRVMEHAGRLELAFFEDSTSYDLIRQAQEEAATRPVTMIANVYGALQSAVTFASVVALLVGLNPWVALVVLLAPVPAFLADSRYGKVGFMVATWASPIRRRMGYISTLLTTDRYAKETKLFRLGGYLTDRFRALGQVFYRRQRRQIVARSVAATGFGAVTTLVGSLTYLYVAMQAVNGRLSLGGLVMYTAAAAAMQGSVQTLFGELTGVYENNLYLDTLHRMLTTRPAITRSADPVPLPEPLRGHVVFEHVTFHYPGVATPALRDVSFEIAPGTTVAVVGRNGAGKSTLVKLLCRLYDPDAGRILLDGVDLRALDPDALHDAVSAVFQDHVTYQATAAENIGLGDVGRLDDRPRIIQAGARGGAHDLIAGLPNGYDTPLGKWFDRGVELSGGEWQKIALSRAFMRDAGLLVFDEPSSALDPAAEHDLFDRLRHLATGRSALYVSHRFSTVRRADRILLLGGGRLLETGTHEELLAADGGYAELFRLQASAFVDVATPAGAVRKG